MTEVLFYVLFQAFYVTALHRIKDEQSRKLKSHQKKMKKNRHHCSGERIIYLLDDMNYFQTSASFKFFCILGIIALLPGDSLWKMGQIEETWHKGQNLDWNKDEAKMEQEIILLQHRCSVSTMCSFLWLIFCPPSVSSSIYLSHLCSHSYCPLIISPALLVLLHHHPLSVRTLYHCFYM